MTDRSYMIREWCRREIQSVIDASPLIPDPSDIELVELYRSIIGLIDKYSKSKPIIISTMYAERTDNLGSHWASYALQNLDRQDLVVIGTALKDYIYNLDEWIFEEPPGAEDLESKRDAAKAMLREVDEVLKVRM